MSADETTRVAPTLAWVGGVGGAFDVTPAKLITCLVTERGLIRPVNADTVQKVIGSTRESVRK